MKKQPYLSLIFFILIFCCRPLVYAQVINTIAGNGSIGWLGDGIAATSSSLFYPTTAVVDASGNVYIADFNQSRVRMVNTSGIITTIAGIGVSGYNGDNIPATTAKLNEPNGVLPDGRGNIYIAEMNGNRIRKINSSGYIYTVAGTGSMSSAGDGGPATNAGVNRPTNLAMDGTGNLYIADWGNNKIRRIDPSGTITTICGTGTATYTGDNGPATAATINNPYSVSLDALGNLYFSDEHNYALRKINLGTNIITTIAGTGVAGFGGDGGPATNAQFNQPDGIVADAGNLYIADYSNNRIRKVVLSTGIVTTVVGNGTGAFSGDGGPATSAEINGPSGITNDATGNFYISDFLNNRIRKVSIGNHPPRFVNGYNQTLTVCENSVADSINSLLQINDSDVGQTETWTIGTSPIHGIVAISYSVSSTGGNITPTGLIYTPSISYSGYDSFKIRINDGISIDSTKIVVTITPLPTVSSITGTNTIATGSTTTLSETTTGGSWSSSNTAITTVGSGGIVSGVSAGSAIISYMVSNSCGSTVVADTITVSGSCTHLISTIAGNGTYGYTGDGGAATAAELAEPNGLAVNGDGFVYIGDNFNNVIRRIDTSGHITTVAGNGTAGFSGDGGPATNAEIHSTAGLAVDGDGNLYIGDSYNSRVRKVSPSGIITTYAGDGFAGYSGDGGAAAAAKLFNPSGLAIDKAGNLYIADISNHVVRKVSKSGIITTYAGNGSSGFSGDGGSALSAQMADPSALAIDGTGNLYISDVSNRRIRKVNSSGIITTIAGNGTAGVTGDGGPATAAELYFAIGLSLDVTGNLYIADGNSETIRKIDTSGIINSVAGDGLGGFGGDGGPATAAMLNVPYNVSADGLGNIYIADGFNNRIRFVNNCSPLSLITGTLEFCAGSTSTFSDATGGGTWSCSDTAIAVINSSTGVATGISQGIATISYTLAGLSATKMIIIDALPSSGSVSGPSSMASGSTSTFSDSVSGGLWSSSNALIAVAGSVSGNVTGIAAGTVIISYAVTNICGSALIADTISITTCTQDISTIAGNDTSGYRGDNGAATSAEMSHPWGLCLDGSGNVFFADNYNNVVRELSSGGIITTVAGNGSAGFSGDGGAATAAQLDSVTGVAVDGAHNIYIADKNNNRIRKVTAAGIISTIAGTGTSGFSGDGSSAITARLSAPNSVITDLAGNIYITDGGNNRVRKINSSGIIHTFAGGGSSGLGDGGAATAAELAGPSGLAIDSNGFIYIGDVLNNRVRQVDTLGIIHTYAGTGTAGFSGDGGPAISAQISAPVGIAMDKGENLYIADAGNNNVRRVNFAGSISTVAGNGTPGYAGNGGPATAAELNQPYGVNTDASGNIYISDGANNCIRLVNNCYPISSSSSSGGGGSSIYGSFTMCDGSTHSITVSIPGGTWRSYNTAIATVSSTGLVTGISPGITTISYTVSGGDASYVVTVESFPSADVITGATNVNTGWLIPLTDPVTGGIWNSSNPAIATVGAMSGNVTGIAAGTSVISYSISNSCGTAVATHTISVNPTSGAISGATTLCVGATSAFSDVVYGGTWSSSNPAVATAGLTTGIITGISAGTATITYTDYSSFITTVVTVFSALPAITGSATICSGTTGLYSDATMGGTWGSSNAAIATIGSGTGIVTGVSTGSAIITYRLACSYTTKVITVLTGAKPIIPASSNICTGFTTTVSDATTGGTWTSSNTAIATVGLTGLVSGVSAGNVTISYSLGSGCTVTTTLNINPHPRLTGNTNVCTGTTTILSDSLQGGLWTSGNTSKATVHCSLGIVTGIASGTAVITYTLCSGCIATATVNVAALTANTGSSGACIGGAITLSNTSPGGVWTSSNTSIATVGSSTGIVTGMALGNVTISYTLGLACSATTFMTVVSLAPNTGPTSVCAGSSITLSNVTERALWVSGTWSSSNTAVAAASSLSGVVTGISAGTAMITYKFGTSCLSTNLITVNPQPTSVTVSGGGTYCSGETITATGGTGGTIYFEGTTTGGNSTLVPSASQMVNTSGTYFFNAYSPAGCWGTQGSATVLIPAITGARNICTGHTTTLSNSGGTTGRWTSSNPAIGSVAPTTGVVNGIAAGTVIIRDSLPTGCIVTANVTVNSSVPSISGPTSVCQGQTITLTNAGAGGTWISSAPTIASVGSTGIVTGVGPGLSATISYELGGCNATYSVSVSPILPIPNTGTNTVCIGQTITLADGVTGGTWSTPGPNISIGSATGIITGINTGSGSVTYTMPTGCFTTTSVTVRVLSAITGPPRVCAIQTITLTDTTVGGSWSTASPTIATIGSGTGIVTGVEGHLNALMTYSLGTGCTTTFLVGVDSLEAITGPVNVCQGQSITLGNIIINGSWSSASPGIATASTSGPRNGLITGVSGGIATISYTTPTGCVTTTPILVNPVIPISGPTSVCVGQTITLSDIASACTGTWSTGSPTIATIGASTGIVTGVAGNLSAPITYTFCTGCRAITSVSVNQLTPILGLATVCQSQTITIIILSGLFRHKAWPPASVSCPHLLH